MAKKYYLLVLTVYFINCLQIRYWKTYIMPILSSFFYYVDTKAVRKKLELKKTFEFALC